MEHTGLRRVERMVGHKGTHGVTHEQKLKGAHSECTVSMRRNPPETAIHGKRTRRYTKERTRNERCNALAKA